MIRLRGVRVHAPPSGPRPGRTLLDVPELNIHKNEYICVVGPNGAGKTRLVLALAGLGAPQEGTITFEESDISSPSVGLVFQQPDDQIVGSTVERDLAFALENLALPPDEIRRRVDAALDAHDLRPRARRPPHLLSEGEKQRLALASALVLRPRLLLLDEPTSRLDPPGRRDFHTRLDRIRAESGGTVLLVTHRSEEILRAERILGLREGRLVFDGSPAELIRSEEGDRLGIRWRAAFRVRMKLGFVLLVTRLSECKSE